MKTFPFHPLRSAYRRSGRTLFGVLLAPVAFLFGATVSPAFVHETAEEFFITGDFTGEGGEDLVVLDRASGLYRLGAAGTGGLIWERTLSTGMEAVHGVSLEKRSPGMPDRLGVTAPEANHFRLVEPGAAPPLAVFPGGIGPVAVMPAAGNGSAADWIVSTIWNKADPYPQRLERMLADGAGFTPGPPQVVPRSWRLPNRVALFRGAAEWTGVMEEDGATGEARFAVYPADFPDWAPVLLAEGLMEGTRYVYGFFDDTDMAAFLFHAPDSPHAEVRRVVKSGDWLALDEWGVIDFGAPVRQVAVARGAVYDRILVVFADSTGSTVYDWDGASAPVPVQSMEADHGLTVTGIVPLTGDGFLLLQGTGGVSTRFVRFAPEGDGYVAVEAGALSPLRPGLHTANVHFFAREPFVHPTPQWLGSAKARDWTSAVRVSGDPVAWEVRAEAFADELRGLGGGFWVPVVPVPEEAGFVLINQYAPAISVFSTNNPVGGVTPPPVIRPPAGRYATAVYFSIEAGEDVQVYYRVEPSGDWSAYSGPRYLYRDTTVQAFAVDAKGRRSTVRNVRYTFTLPPERLDSNGDGVPDFVKLAFGLDPRGPADSTGNGFTDLEELLAGCDPSDPSDVPGERASAGASLAVEVLPAAYDGFTEESAAVAPGTAVSAFEGTGTRRLALGSAASETEPGEWPRAHLDCFSVEPTDALILVATEFHFRIVTDHDEDFIGRELLAFTEVPLVEKSVIEYQYEGGDLMAEALRWREALHAAHAVSPPSVDVFCDPVETLLVALFERRVGMLLEARGLIPSGIVTLTPFRGDAAGRTPVAPSTMALLQGRDDENHPPLNLRSLFSDLRGAVHKDDAGSNALRALTMEVYRISSRMADEFPGRFVLPFDALRAFVGEGVFPSSYAEHIRLTPSETGLARDLVDQLMQRPVQRPLESFHAVIPAGTAVDGYTVLTSLAMEDWALFNESGEAFAFPTALALLPGSRIRVEGYADVAVPACSDRAMEVRRIDMVAVPFATPADADGNLLGDDWERLHFGTTGQNPFNAADGSEYSVLQQYLEGTDPRDALCLPEGPALSLEPPVITAVHHADGLGLSWQWPATYADAVEFVLFSSENLLEFAPDASVGTHHGDGSFSLSIPKASYGDPAFFRLGMRLR